MLKIVNNKNSTKGKISDLSSVIIFSIFIIYCVRNLLYLDNSTFSIILNTLGIVSGAIMVFINIYSFIGFGNKNK